MPAYRKAINMNRNKRNWVQLICMYSENSSSISDMIIMAGKVIILLIYKNLSLLLSLYRKLFIQVSMKDHSKEPVGH